MKFIEFGSENRRVSDVVLGLMRIPQLETPQKVSELLHTALESGINMLDIADCYSKGRAEELLGETFALEPQLRDKFFLQSKCGIVKDPFYFFDFSKEHIIKAAEDSLRRLKTDHLDCLLLHRPDALMEPEEICEAFSLLKEQGKVLDFGVSNFNPAQMKLLQRGIDVKLACNQVQMSVCHTVMIDSGFNVNMDNDASVMHDGGILEHCSLQGTVVQAWSVMQHGFFKGVFIGDPHYLRLNSVLDRIAAEQGVTSTAVAIAWVLRVPGRMQAVIGTTRPERVKNSARASDVRLSRQQWYEIYLAAGNELP
ncbi:MAG: aldo/keto reductase [Succinivibrio sp.]|jgi:predicted oxidoreductase|nr:aldo/keto reductase [Succinivibrio sp.]